MPRTVVLTIDGLGAKHLGPYGNTWLETPAFNHLAATAHVWDDLFAPSADPSQTLTSVWQGSDVGGHLMTDLSEVNLIEWCNANQYHTKLLTDDPSIVSHRMSAFFAEQSEIQAPTGVKLADQWDETHSAVFFARAVQMMEELQDGEFLWLSSRGLGNPWDAPYEFRQQFSDEDDPDPSGSAQVPALVLDADFDPDTLHEIQCAFAGQVSLIDRCLGVLLSVLQEMKDVLFVVTSLRGFPLAEHLRVGWKETALYHELLHVPCFVWRGDGLNALTRCNELREFHDITATLLTWLSQGSNTTRTKGSHLSVSRHETETLVRTKAWQLRFPALELGGETENDNDSRRASELYLKPDDQNEVNNVADLRPDVIDAGLSVLSKIEANTALSEIRVPDALLDSAE